MSGRRILFLGTTGVNKTEVLERLVGYSKSEFAREIHVVDFGKDYLSRIVEHSQYLDQPVKVQHERWRQAWAEFSRENGSVINDPYQGPDIFLALHGCHTRGHYGTRLVADPSDVAAFRPHLIVTLLDNIYDLWWRTEERAGGNAWKGRPTLEQLALARRVEAAFGDITMCRSDTKPRHLLIAAAHPCRTVANAIYGTNTEVIYLSFPISEPRRMAEQGDHSGIDEVNDFIRRSAEFERSCRSASFICPLAIDELPFVYFGMDTRNAANVSHNIGGGRTELKTGFVFPRDRLCWDLTPFWPKDQRMKVGPIPGPAFLCEQLEAASGNMRSDVGWRDYRLAEQANRLLVFNPVMNGEQRRKLGKNGLAHGVTAEIGYALAQGIPVYVFQDEKHDPNHEWAAWYDTIQGGASMGQGHTGSRLTWSKTIDTLFQGIGR